MSWKDIWMPICHFIRHACSSAIDANMESNNQQLSAFRHAVRIKSHMFIKACRSRRRAEVQTEHHDLSILETAGLLARLF